MMKSWMRSGVPRTTSIKSVETQRSGHGPKTRMIASVKPAPMARHIPTIETLSVSRVASKSSFQFAAYRCRRVHSVAFSEWAATNALYLVSGRDGSSG